MSNKFKRGDFVESQKKNASGFIDSVSKNAWEETTYSLLLITGNITAWHKESDLYLVCDFEDIKKYLDFKKKQLKKPER